MTKEKSKKNLLWHSIKVGLIALLILVIYAYGFAITKVNFNELRSPTRQSSLQRVIRALVRPDILAYDQTEQVLNYPVYVPCHADGSLPPAPIHASTDPYLIVTPGCGSPGDVLQVEGFNLAPRVDGPVRFAPGSDINNIVTLGRDVVQTNDKGHFSLAFSLPKRPDVGVQYIRATLRQNIGSPHLTQTAKDTWNKIVETVFLALLATTFGTILAIPLSFIAARNLMKPVKSPLSSIAFSLIGWPVGIVAGLVITRWMGNFSSAIIQLKWLGPVLIIPSIALIFLGFRWAVPQSGADRQGSWLTILRSLVLLVCVLLGAFASYLVSDLFKQSGSIILKSLGMFGFLGNFLYQGGDILGIMIPAIGSLVGGAALGGLLSGLGRRISETLPETVVKVINLILSPIACATIFVILGQLIAWLYLLDDPVVTFWGPLGIGLVVGLVLAMISKAKSALPTGLVIYTITRTFLNGLRSIEALVMAIVFVIAVGIGPFAGMMALGLHTIVSLAKLYSEQVESIQSGPLEAIQATGANRLQTIIYGVIPQIVPPYISYTMYRWDINVRMSTIIGFVGGGGIGFLLQQNINLLNYRGASAQMLAIAVVVASMDYISSVLREKTL